MNNQMMPSQEKLLLLNESEQKVPVTYADNDKPFMMPLIGPRPPYFTNPRYQLNYPVI